MKFWFFLSLYQTYGGSDFFFNCIRCCNLSVPIWLFNFVIAAGEITLSMIQVASWGAYLLKRNVLAMSFAPRDNHEAQVQFALERGVPAVIGVLGSIRLPYPSRAFDMAQCSRCLIPWTSNGKF